MSETNNVWEQTLDNNRFRAWVVRSFDNAYLGTLRVEVVATKEKILEKGVPLQYGAPFGPDVADVGEWQAASIAAADEWIAKQ